MPQHPLRDVRAAIHKTAAGQIAATVPPAQASSAVSQDLAVMADQAAQFSRGQAAGNQQAVVDKNASAAGIAQERQQADQARAEELEAQRREMQRIQAAARQAEMEAALERQAEAQRVAIRSAQEQEQRIQNSMRRSAEVKDKRDAAIAEAQEARMKRLQEMADRESARKAGVIRDVAQSHGALHNEVFEEIVTRAPDSLWEAGRVINTMGREGLLDKDTGPYGGVRMDIIIKDLKRLYGNR